MYQPVHGFQDFQISLKIMTMTTDGSLVVLACFNMLTPDFLVERRFDGSVAASIQIKSISMSNTEYSWPKALLLVNVMNNRNNRE